MASVPVCVDPPNIYAHSSNKLYHISDLFSIDFKILGLWKRYATIYKVAHNLPNASKD